MSQARPSGGGDIRPVLSQDGTGQLVLGTMLGPYRIVDVIGMGGMGTVYLAEHVRLGRLVALKVLRSELAERQSAVSRFFAEARAANQIRHENIIEVTDFIEDPDQGLYCLVMELLRGESLLMRIQDRGALPVPQAVEIAIQMANALAAAHEVGIIHRDLKPENIFVSERAGRRNFVKILDFGVAKLTEDTSLRDAGALASPTAPGVVLGTPAYMSPEQGGGKGIDHRTDIYSFGVILFEMLTGDLPFRGDSFGDFLVKHMTAPPPRASESVRAGRTIPPALDDLILRCLAKDPLSRPGDMSDVEVELQAVASRLAAPAAAVRRRPRRRRGTWAFAIAAAVVVVAGAVAGVLAVMNGTGLELLSGAGLDVARLGGDHAAPATEAAGPLAQPSTAAHPATITVRVESTPEGAEVWRGDERLGVTPCDVSLEWQDATAAVEVRREGFEPARRDVRLDADGRLALELVALPAEDAAVDAGAADAAPAVKVGRRDRTRVRPRRDAGAGTRAPVKTGTTPRDRNALVDPYAE